MLAFFGVSKKGSLCGHAQVSLEAEDRWTEILKVGIALAASMGVPGLDTPLAVGQAGEHLKTRQTL